MLCPTELVLVNRRGKEGFQDRAVLVARWESMESGLTHSGGEREVWSFGLFFFFLGGEPCTCKKQAIESVMLSPRRDQTKGGWVRQNLNLDHVQEPCRYHKVQSCSGGMVRVNLTYARCYILRLSRNLGTRCADVCPPHP